MILNINSKYIMAKKKIVRFNNYETLQRLSPNILDDKGNSKNLFEGEKSSEENCSNGVSNEVANEVAYEVAYGVPYGVAYGVAYETEQRRARVNKRESKSERERENKSFNQSKEENRNLSMEDETGLLSFSDKTTDYETDSGDSLEDYGNGLKLESKEVEPLFDFAGDEAEFFITKHCILGHILDKKFGYVIHI